MKKQIHENVEHISICICRRLVYSTEHKDFIVISHHYYVHDPHTYTQTYGKKVQLGDVRGPSEATFSFMSYRFYTSLHLFLLSSLFLR